MRRVVWSIEAEAALARAFGEMRDAVERLSHHPWLGHRRADVPAPFLGLRVGRHVLVYRFDDAEIVVMALFHDAMDIRSRIKEILRRMAGPTGL